MAKSSSIVIWIAALLLFQQHSAARAEAPPWEPRTFTVSKSGWMNLRKIVSSDKEFRGQFWYVCGHKKMISFFPPRELKPNDEIEVFDKQPDNEFFGYIRLVRTIEEFITNAAKRERFMVTAAAACGAPANPETPTWMNLAASPTASFYYLSERDFRVNGSTRTYWVNGHPARQVTARLKRSSDDQDQPAFIFEPYKTWLVKYERNEIQRQEMNCASNKMRSLVYVKYDPSGKILESSQQPTQSEFIVPDTVADGWREIVCLIK